MRTAVALLIYVAGAFVLGALLAFPLHTLLALTGAESVPFHKLAMRIVKVLALLGLWPLLSVLGLNTRVHWGFGLARARFFKEMLKGLGIGIAMLAVLVAVLLALGIRVLETGPGPMSTALVSLLVKALAAGIAVALIEECWFRGALFSAVARHGAVLPAIASTALLYALVHFIRADVPVDAGALDWSSGFVAVGNSFGRFSSPAILDSLAALFAAGVFLALVRHATGSIAQCIGIHAGWVIVIKVTRGLSHVDRDASWQALAGHYDGVIGYLGLAWLAALSTAYYLVLVRPRRRAQLARPTGRGTDAV